MGIDYEPESTGTIRTDVLIVGSGPIGAVYARKLVDAGHNVLMVDAGAQETEIPGDHKKNASEMTLNEFSSVIQNDLTPLSSSSSMPGAAATLAIGGMSTHWTCVTAAPHPTLEAPKLFPEAQWTPLLSEAQDLLNTNSTTYDTSTRQENLKNVLNASGHSFKSTPLACQKAEDGKIVYTSTSTILSPIFPSKNFTLLPLHLCTKLHKQNGAILSASITSFSTNTQISVIAKQYILAAGAVLTPQILHNSGMDNELPALGRYLTERMVGFCQVRLDKKFSTMGGEVNIMEGAREGKKWVTTINREAHQYGQLPEDVDGSDVLDVRCMSVVEPNVENRVKFGEKGSDGMPMPSFTVSPSNDDLKVAAKMMVEMQSLATTLGSFITEPTIMPLGTALHLSGTTRAGTSVENSVVDVNSKVWGVDNLYLGGCGVIAEGMACQPTLTAVGYALQSVERVKTALQSE
ncbi:uncharacterized protein DFL_000578 [Arthrobotrys flagrans]|uniref:FAD/NAD(P)-binding domain-containing protein n=1 Tax=Arthrobotrys flagrans TaxID=97331 RepID=A0A437AE59_ARTFL|nr:hypothetical protein DFL_000578 [Arthrobotrys flagrans]